MNNQDFNLNFLTAQTFQEKVFWAEKILERFGDNTIARDPEEIPSFTYMGQNITHVCATEGKNAIFQDGMIEFGKVIQDQEGGYWNANYGRLRLVKPIFT